MGDIRYAQIPAAIDMVNDVRVLDTPGNLKPRDRIGLEVANLKEATRVIVENHYLRRGRTMAQLPYWITFDGHRAGVMLFAYPRLSVKFQGYGPMNLLELARLWIDPRFQGLKVVDGEGREHSFSVATCAVGKALRRVRQDWHHKYPHLPDVLAIVSWADTVHHEGTIYRAANFREVGRSGGSLHGNAHRKNGGRDQLNPDYLHEKISFIYEFQRPWRPRRNQSQTTPVEQLSLPIAPKGMTSFDQSRAGIGAPTHVDD